MTLKIVILGAAIAASSLSLAPMAWASGNEHVVDDAAVETPGVCHLEAWATRFGPRQGLVNLAPACTRKAWPRLELGAGFQRAWTPSGRGVATLGPALKLNILPEEQGLGLGLTGAAAYDPRSGHVETATLVAPVTLPVSDRLRINLNAGWSYARTSERHQAAFYGVQGELAVTRTLTLMVESFRREGGDPGAQAGVRWNPGGGRFDLDLVVGRRVDGESPRALSLGFTVRR